MSTDSLTAADRMRLLDELIMVFDTWGRIRHLREYTAAETLGLHDRRETVEELWRSVAHHCDVAAASRGYRELLALALEVHPHNRVFNEIARMLTPGADHPAAPVVAPRSRPPLRILVVATEWSSHAGGLSTYNRRLCVALAQAGAEVTCLAASATSVEVDAAAAERVRLVQAIASPGSSPQEALYRPPTLIGGPPDVVIGHGRITGPAAQAHCRDHYPAALGVHLVHMAPDEIEWHKPHGGIDRSLSAEERTNIEVDLAESAGLVAAVGPGVFGLFQLELWGFPNPSDIIRLDPGFMPPPIVRPVPPSSPVRVLLFGRLEDAELKGVDIAARAVAYAAQHLRHGPELQLLVRGVPPGEGDRLREQMISWAGPSSLEVLPRVYTVDKRRVEANLRSSSLVLMPSRADGFGLAGVEAIEQGTPLLASAKSGLGRYLREFLPPEQSRRMIVDDHPDPEVAWGQEILGVVKRREAAFADAAAVAAFLGELRPWSTVAADLLSAVRARL
ncbi:glycosyltransferase [Actinoplanes sp. NPDC049118]|uniref:glycosyltransferase n=1 Tax=Actinoplanes sp. NPDC049118 TaxID=3155769 RepID=UPI00340F296B